MRIRTQAVLLSVVPLTFLIILFIIASVLQTKTDQTATWSQRSTNTLKQSEQIAKTIGDANAGMVEYTTKKAGPASLAHGNGPFEHRRDVYAPERGRHQAEIRERGIAPADVCGI